MEQNKNLEINQNIDRSPEGSLLLLCHVRTQQEVMSVNHKAGPHQSQPVP